MLESESCTVGWFVPKCCPEIVTGNGAAPACQVLGLMPMMPGVSSPTVNVTGLLDPHVLDIARLCVPVVTLAVGIVKSTTPWAFVSPSSIDV